MRRIIMPAQAYAKKPLHQQWSKDKTAADFNLIGIIKLFIFLKLPTVIIKYNVLHVQLFPPQESFFLKNSSIFISGVEIDR